MTDRLLPNWLLAYMAFTAELEAPDNFHMWTGLSTLAGAIQRKAFFDFKYFLLYPNLFIVLVAPAGKCKKSTAMRVGRELLAMIPEVSFTSDSTSRERLIQDLSQTHRDGHSSMTAYSSEFASLLTTSGMDMVVFLTDIYDSPNEWTHRTKISGTNRIIGPCLNIEGATTPDWLARSLPLDTIGIGLTSRIIFVYADKRRSRKAFPDPSPEQRQLRELLIRDLAQVSRISGMYVLTPEAKRTYEAWYNATADNPNDIGDPRLDGYFERKPQHIIKVAMLLAASRTNELLIELADVEKAWELLKLLEPGMAKAFSAVGKNPLALDNELILGAIIAQPGITISELMAMFRHNLRMEELEEVLSTLQLSRFVKPPVATEFGPKYYPADGLFADPNPNPDKP